MSTAVIALGVAAGAVAIYKMLTSSSGSLSVFTFRMTWGR